MKIVSWNCNGALRRKTQHLDLLDADVCIIQECENPEFADDKFKRWAGDYLWTGSSKSRGLGIFPRKGNRVREQNWQGSFRFEGATNTSQAWSWTSSDLKLFLPFTINDDYTVLGVWTKPDGAHAFKYVGQLWKYLQIHRGQLSRPRTVIVGDFNSNSIWDQSDRWWNHSDVMNEMEAIGLLSSYHLLNGEMQGKEKTPTFFMQRNLEKPYHIDYALISSDLTARSRLSIGAAADWLEFSDHMPITLELVT